MLLSEFLASDLAEKPFLAVLGNPVSHSLSPAIHNETMSYYGIKACYYAVECPVNDIQNIAGLLHQPAFIGANITIPLKKEIIRFLDSLDESSEEIGAVNTVVRDVMGSRLSGFNTDVFGFLKPLEAISGIQTAVILGTGGASRAVKYALQKKGVEKIFLASRKIPGSNPRDIRKHGNVELVSYDSLEMVLSQSDMVVNTTPVGMYPNTDASPVSGDLLPCLKNKICYDIIYNPLETSFMRNAKEHGAIAIGGLDMFIHQAAKSFELWFKKAMPVDLVRQLLLDSLHKIQR